MKKVLEEKDRLVRQGICKPGEILFPGNYEVKKETCFVMSKKEYSDFILKLEYLGLKRSMIFNEFVNGVIEEDEDLIKYLRKVRDKKTRIKKERKEKYQKYDKIREEVKKRYGINKKEIENIFDILELDGIL